MLVLLLPEDLLLLVVKGLHPGLKQLLLRVGHLLLQEDLLLLQLMVLHPVQPVDLLHLPLILLRADLLHLPRILLRLLPHLLPVQPLLQLLLHPLLL